MVGRGAIGGIDAKAPMLERAAVMVAAVMLATAAFIVMLGIAAMPGKPMVRFIGRLGTGSGRGNDKGVGDGVGKGNWRIAFGLRLSGMGIPALAHIAAALAFAISSS